MAYLLIKNGRVVDPQSDRDEVCDVLVEDDRISRVEPQIECADATVVDATDRIVVPGLIDLLAQLREPGFEEDETIASGLAAAAAGGFTTVACLPNTDPPIDSAASVEFVQLQGDRAGGANVAVIATVSKNRDGEQLAEIGSLASAGAVAFSDAPAPIHNPDLMRRALEYCLMFDRPVMSHPEVRELTSGGIMHEGLVSTLLGLPGLPAEAEDVMTSRDLRLTEATGGRVHLTNISTAASVDLIRRAKQRGVQVTAGVTAAHLTMNDSNLRTFNSRYKVNPPLRSQEHIDACLEGLRDGTLDVIVSGHAPRAIEKKMCELDLAPFGMTGLETTLPLVITKLVHAGILTWSQVVQKMSVNPARILGFESKGALAVGNDADITVIDPQVSWTVTSECFQSKSQNTPLIDNELTGRAEIVIVGGRLVRSPSTVE